MKEASNVVLLDTDIVLVIVWFPTLNCICACVIKILLTTIIEAIDKNNLYKVGGIHLC